MGKASKEEKPYVYISQHWIPFWELWSSQIFMDFPPPAFSLA